MNEPVVNTPKIVTEDPVQEEVKNIAEEVEAAEENDSEFPDPDEVLGEEDDE